MQITYKRNGLKNYMIVKNDKEGPAGLREKMIVRNNIDYLIKMTPQSIDGISYFYYDIQGRVNLEALFTGRHITKSEISAILAGVSGLLSELQRYLLSPDEVLFSPSEIWILPDTLTPAFVYVPDMIPDEKYNIRSLADFLAEHTDGSDRDAAALAYGYLEMVENGCIMPEIHDADRMLFERAGSITPPGSMRDEEPPVDPDDHWDIKEGIADEMKPFFGKAEKTNTALDKKKTAYISLSLVIAAAAVYILLVLNPSLFHIYMTDEEYITAGVIISIVFAIVLMGVFLVCGRKPGEPEEMLCREEDVFPDIPKPQEDRLEYMEYTNQWSDETDEKTVLLKRPVSTGTRLTCPVLKYADGRDLTITTFPFIVGKMKTRVDGVIDGKGISRIHAMLKETDGRYYISDLNSMNGTGINGRALNANETAEITEGDIISFADTSLTFHTKAC